MSAAELEAAIVGPAERGAARGRAALVAELVAAVIDEPAALPSLQYTLYELAERAPIGDLTLAAYRSSAASTPPSRPGPRQLYRSLDDADRDAVRRVFERLVVVGAEGEPTRRRALRSELAALPPGRSVDDVVEAWAQARLLTLDRHPDDPGADRRGRPRGAAARVAPAARLDRPRTATPSWPWASSATPPRAGSSSTVTPAPSTAARASTSALERHRPPARSPAAAGA